MESWIQVPLTKIPEFISTWNPESMAWKLTWSETLNRHFLEVKKVALHLFHFKTHQSDGCFWSQLMRRKILYTSNSVLLFFFKAAVQKNKVFSFFFQITVIQDLADVPAMALILTSLVFIWLFPKGIYNETHDFLVN